MSTASGAKFWTQHYSAGVPAEVDTSGYRSVVDLFERSAQQYRDRSAYVCMGKKLSFAEVDEYSRKFAAYLQSVGIKKGTRVAIYMGMVPELAVAMLACTRIGAPHTVVFGGFSADSLADRLNDMGCEVLITQDEAYRRGNPVPLKTTADEALATAPGVKKTLVLRRTGNAVPMTEGRFDLDEDLLGAGHRQLIVRPEFLGEQLEQARHAGRRQVVRLVVANGLGHRLLHRGGRVKADIPLIETEGFVDGVHHVADADDARQRNGIEERGHA